MLEFWAKFLITVKRHMYIAGGNSKMGALKDLWKLDLDREEWTRLEDMPGSKRYSFSMHLWKHFIIVFGGCPGNKSGLLNDILVYNIKNQKWIKNDKLMIKQGEFPKPRCRHGSNIISRENEIAEMFVFGGWHGIDDNGDKLKDVWKATFNFTQAGIFQIEWEKLDDMNTKAHRCFSFSIKDRTFLWGGFGNNLMKLQDIFGNVKIVTHDNLNLPPKWKEDFRESKSIAGFGAVYDDLDYGIQQ